MKHNRQARSWRTAGKRLFAIALSLLFVLSVMPGKAYATDELDLDEQMAQQTLSYEKVEGLDGTVLSLDFSNYQPCIQGWGTPEWAKTYKSFDGREFEANSPALFEYLKDQGVNTISVKVLVEADKASGDDRWFSLDNAKLTLKAAKDAGLKTNVILVFSDHMTYANDQKIPASWKNDDGSALTSEQKVTKATSLIDSIIGGLMDAGADPDIVTIGSSVNWNFLDITGDDAWIGWRGFGDISKKIKEKAPDAKVSIGVAAPDDPSGIKWILDKLNDQWNPVDYDYVAVTMWDKDPVYLSSLKETFAEEEKNANKDAQLYVTEFTASNFAGAEDVSRSIYTQMDDIYSMLETGCGMVYKDASYTGNWSSLTEDDGTLTPSIAVFRYALGNNDPVYIDTFRFGGSSGYKDVPVNVSKIEGMNENTIRGIDVGSYKALKDAGVKFYDYDGNEVSLMEVLSENGVNYVRLRIWNDPYGAADGKYPGKTYGGGNPDVETALSIAKEAKQNHIKVELCFHYSDFWADPAQQNLPKAWVPYKDDPEKMKSLIYDFTYKSVKRFVDAGVEVGMVQVGNEITNGSMGMRKKPYTALWGNEKQSKLLNSYLNAGCKAVRDAAPEALIAMHLETPNVEKYRTIMETWERDGLDYDVLGTSYYPYWGVKAGANTPETLEKVTELAKEKGKMLVVLETAWPYTLKDGDGQSGSIGTSANVSAYDVSPQGQVNELTDTYAALGKHDNTLGAFYWEGAWLPVKPGWKYWEYNKNVADEKGTGWAASAALEFAPDYKMHYDGNETWGASSWEGQALFDLEGHPLQSLKFYKDSQSGSKILYRAIAVNEKGEKLNVKPVFAKLSKGQSKTVTLGKIDGYVPKDGSYKVKITADGKTGTVIDIKVPYVKKAATESGDKDDITPTDTAAAKAKSDAKLGAPKGLGSNAYVSKRAITVSFDKVEGALNYRISYRKAGASSWKTVWTKGKTSFQLTGLTAGASYDIKVTAFRKNSSGVWYKGSDSNQMHRYLDYAKGLKAAPKATAMDLSWKKLSGATGYQIRYSRSKDMSDATFARIKGVDTVEKTLSKLSTGKTYYVQIRPLKAISGTTYYGAYTISKAVTLDRDAITPAKKVANNAKVSKNLAAPKVTMTYNAAKKSVTLETTVVKGAVNYRIAYRKAGTTDWSYKWSKGKTTARVTGLKANTAYQFRVTAFKKTASGSWVRSKHSLIKRQYVRTGKSLKLTAKTGAMTASWAKAQSATGYKVQYCSKSSMKGAKTLTVKKSSVTKKAIKKLKSSKTYYVRVRPYKVVDGKTYLGEWSKIKSVTVK